VPPNPGEGLYDAMIFTLTALMPSGCDGASRFAHSFSASSICSLAHGGWIKDSRLRRDWSSKEEAQSQHRTLTPGIIAAATIHMHACDISIREYKPELASLLPQGKAEQGCVTISRTSTLHVAMRFSPEKTTEIE
jgi:hypothetical protein